MHLVWYRSLPLEADIRPLHDSTATASVAKFVILCGTEGDNATGEMHGLISSALLLSTIPLHLIFITDKFGAIRIKSMFDHLPRWRMPLRVQIVVISPKIVNIFSKAIDVDPRATKPGLWGIAKMTIPWLLPDISFFAVLDTDMVFIRDPARLWAEFGYGNGDGNSEWAFKMPLFPAGGKPSVNNICSCVVLVDSVRARSANIWPHLVRRSLAAAIERGGRETTWYKPKLRQWHIGHGDQGLYWLLLRYRPELISGLNPRWNTDRCHNWKSALNPKSGINIGLLHRNCAGSDARKTSDQANDFFRYYQKFRWQWMVPDNGTGHNVVITTQSAVRLTTSSEA